MGEKAEDSSRNARPYATSTSPSVVAVLSASRGCNAMDPRPGGGEKTGFPARLAEVSVPVSWVIAAE